MNEIWGYVVGLALIGLSATIWTILRDKQLDRYVAVLIKSAEMLIPVQGTGVEKMDWVMENLKKRPLFKTIPDEVLRNVIEAHVLEMNETLYGETPKEDCIED